MSGYTLPGILILGCSVSHVLSLENEHCADGNGSKLESWKEFSFHLFSQFICFEFQSVILPVHDAEPWLDECLESVLQQDFRGSWSSPFLMMPVRYLQTSCWSFSHSVVTSDHLERISALAISAFRTNPWLSLKNGKEAGRFRHPRGHWRA